MQTMAAGFLGSKRHAAYPILAHVLVLFGIAGEPISQSAQAMLRLRRQRRRRCGKGKGDLRDLVALAVGIAVTVRAASVGERAWQQILHVRPRNGLI